MLRTGMRPMKLALSGAGARIIASNTARAPFRAYGESTRSMRTQTTPRPAKGL